MSARTPARSPPCTRPAVRTDVAGIARGERWHRVDTGGQLRAAIFGISDGLISNLSLVIGVAGANPDGSFIVLAGVAGLLAGAFSMGAGEFVSVTSQRELFERQIALEKEELEMNPEEERRELALIYRAKGLPQDEADALSARIIADRGVALETLAREELGLNPEGLGSPYGVAIASFLAFAAGAIIPLFPWFFGSSAAFFVASIVLSGHRAVRRRRRCVIVHRPQLCLRRPAPAPHRRGRRDRDLHHRPDHRSEHNMSTEVWLDDFEVEDERTGAKIARNPLVRIIFLVDLILRIIALYVAWRAHHRKWFVALLVVNSAGILPAAYLLRFRPRGGPDESD